MFKKIKYFVEECLTITGLSFIMIVLMLSAIEAGMWQERKLLENSCKSNGDITINDINYICNEEKKQ